jgi:hypothetical protein
MLWLWRLGSLLSLPWVATKLAFVLQLHAAGTISLPQPSGFTRIGLCEIGLWLGCLVHCLNWVCWGLRSSSDSTTS